MSSVRSYLGNLLPDMDTDVLHRGGGTDRVKQLEEDVENLSMILRAVIDLLVQKKSITREDLRRLLMAIDQSDGATDGTAMRIPTGRSDERAGKKRK